MGRYLTRLLDAMRRYLAFLLALFASLVIGAAAFMVMAGLGFGARSDGKGTDLGEQVVAFTIATVLAAVTFAAAGKLMGLRVTARRVVLATLPPLLVFQVLLWQVPVLESEGAAGLLTLLLMATVGYILFRRSRRA